MQLLELGGVCLAAKDCDVPYDSVSEDDEKCSICRRLAAARNVSTFRTSLRAQEGFLHDHKRMTAG